MGLVQGGKRGFRAWVLATGACLTLSGVAAAQSTGEDWKTGEDWRTLRRIDLPALLVRATWSESSYLSEGHPMAFGRTGVRMNSGDAARGTVVKTPKNANFGVLIDNLSCYNSVRGDRKCALLLNEPNSCYLFIYAESAVSGNEDFRVECPESVTLGR